MKKALFAFLVAVANVAFCGVDNVVTNLATTWIDKTVTEFEDGTNATVQILVKTTPESEAVKPNVLFIGTACSSHGLTSDVIRKSLNAASKNAKTVDYYIYTARSSSAVASGTLSNGKQLNSFSLSMGGGQHGALSKFYNTLYNVFSNEATAEKYDYIVFEFDGSRLGSGYSQHSQEAFVASKMLKYYQEQRVIWIVDACHNANNEVWPNDYWRPNTYYYSAGNKKLTDAEYRGIVGLFDPDDYAQNGTAHSMSKTSISVNRSSLGKTTFYANDRYPIQADYTNPNEVVNLISQIITPVSYEVKTADAINFSLGLNLDGVEAFWATNATSTANLVTNLASSSMSKWTNGNQNVKWTQFSQDQLETTPSNMVVKLAGIKDVLAMKFLVHVSDVTGKFLNSADGAVQTDDGKYQKDPNDGPAVVSLKTETGKELESDAIAYTRMKWEFTTFKIDCIVMEGEGDFDIAGRRTNELEVARATSPSVVPTPGTGYAIYKVEVDGEEVPVEGLNIVFENLDSDHVVKIWCCRYANGLWIVDHAHAGAGFVHLAFEPLMPDGASLDQKLVDYWRTNQCIKIKRGATPSDLSKSQFENAKLRDDIGNQNLDRGWVWITVPHMPDEESGFPSQLVKIFIAPAKDVDLPTAESLNIFGMAKVESLTTNTLVAVPWTWYSKSEHEAIAIPSRRLVKQTALNAGDLLYDYKQDGAYRAWIATGEDWTPCTTVVAGQDGTGGIGVFSDADGSDAKTTMESFRAEMAGENVSKVARGNAIWLRRRVPSDAFWLYGQYVGTQATNAIAPAVSGESYRTTLLGNPYMKPVRINDLKFEGEIASMDRIFIPDGTLTPKTLMYKSGKGWRTSYSVIDEKTGLPKTCYDYDATVPAGLGFWYDRRGTGRLSVVW